jgi:putative restriction endonuclease
VRLYVGVTDYDWFSLLASIPGIDEVNFWQPSGTGGFRALSPGELFLFKLHSPNNFVVGGGVFAYRSLLPTSLAWAAFERKNGANSLNEMRRRIERYRRQSISRFEDYAVGCILLEQPFFFPRDLWIPVPSDWASNIVRGKGYDTSTDVGLELWRSVNDRLPLLPSSAVAVREAVAERYGPPATIRPRLGQGSFRILVTDAYGRRCAVTRERTLPVLQAAHVKPYAAGGEHDVRNGLLLRSDLHVLFDQGYLTVTPDLHLEVSRRIREEFENGRDYYALHGRDIARPLPHFESPDPELLRWHADTVYRG